MAPPDPDLCAIQLWPAADLAVFEAKVDEFSLKYRDNKPSELAAKLSRYEETQATERKRKGNECTVSNGKLSNLANLVATVTALRRLQQDPPLQPSDIQQTSDAWLKVCARACARTHTVFRVWVTAMCAATCVGARLSAAHPLLPRAPARSRPAGARDAQRQGAERGARAQWGRALAAFALPLTQLVCRLCPTACRHPPAPAGTRRPSPCARAPAAATWPLL